MQIMRVREFSRQKDLAMILGTQSGTSRKILDVISAFWSGLVWLTSEEVIFLVGRTNRQTDR